MDTLVEASCFHNPVVVRVVLQLALRMNRYNESGRNDLFSAHRGLSIVLIYLYILLHLHV